MPDKTSVRFFHFPFTALEFKVLPHIGELQHKSAAQVKTQESGAKTARSQHGVPQFAAGAAADEFTAGKLEPGMIETVSPMFVCITIA